MSRNVKILGIVIVMFLISCGINIHTSNAANTNVKLEIAAGVITLFAPSNFDLWIITINSSTQYLTWQFMDYFIVDDAQWSNSGYYTTLASSALNQSWGSAFIPAENIALKIDNITGTNGTIGVDLLSGTANTGVAIPLWLTNYTPMDGLGQTYIKRNPGENDGILGKYGNKPYIQITIPAYQRVGIYTGTLTYTLFQ